MLAPTEKSGYICHGVPPSPPQPQPQMMARGRRLTAQLLLCSVAGAGAGGVRRRSGCVSGTASTPQLVARHAPTPVRGAAPTQQPLRRASSAICPPKTCARSCALRLAAARPWPIFAWLTRHDDRDRWTDHRSTRGWWSTTTTRCTWVQLATPWPVDGARPRWLGCARCVHAHHRPPTTTLPARLRNTPRHPA
jgi:hypothetical protein